MENDQVMNSIISNYNNSKELRSTNKQGMENETTHEVNKSTQENQQYFLDNLYSMMISEVIEKAKDRTNKIVEFKHPKELEKLFDLEIKERTSDDQLLALCKDIIKYSVKTGEI